MRFKPLILIITAAGCNVIASSQLKFSQDTCVFFGYNISGLYYFIAILLIPILVYFFKIDKDIFVFKEYVSQPN